MLKSIIKWVLFALALILVAKITPGVEISSFIAAMIAIAVIGLINVFIKPIITILTLPINILTLGLFTFIINAALFGLTAFLVPGFSVGGFFPAIVGSILFSIFSMIINMYGRMIEAYH